MDFSVLKLILSYNYEKFYRHSVPLKVYIQYKFGKEILKITNNLMLYCIYVKFY